VDDREQPQRAGRRHFGATPTELRVLRMVNAAKAEASDLRYEAEQEARAMRREAESDARRRVETARRSSEELILGRAHDLSELTTEIQDRYRGILQDLDRAAGLGTELRLVLAKLERERDRVAREASEPTEALAADAPIDGVE
jgi:hypothetical protein